MAALSLAPNTLSPKKGHSTGIWLFYPKSFNNKPQKEELCYIKFKLDIELNEVVIIRQILINTNRSMGGFIFFATSRNLDISFEKLRKNSSAVRVITESPKGGRAKPLIHRNKGFPARKNANYQSLMKRFIVLIQTGH